MKTLIHPTAVIHPDAQLHPTVEVGPYAVIGAQVKVGADTTIGAHVAIEGCTEIGARNRIFPGAAIGFEPQDLKYSGASSLTKIGDGNTIREYVTINRATGEGEATAIGNDNLLMAYVHIAHNCEIGDRVVITNTVQLAGHVRIENHARVGGVLGIHQFVHIGELAMVGGMTRIDRDVPPYMLVEGNPSRVRSLNLIGLKRAGVSPDDLSMLKKAFRLIYRSEETFKQALEQLTDLPQTPYLLHLSEFLRQSITGDRRGPIPGRRRDSSPE
ncbi:acyl-ACP--UDP-N-acetylglucosamine O-acyltransferase [Laspinema olomoucense]|uniref:Acyl-[acyl-carrier-protein]--UDP-N-acetylglucosamine O-acyltransferase n=1 Tax=Laspinema olomoucense D3b TaxID=2953688 RepID=A0ABT2N3B6_9CYAN|nr:MULTISPECIES: acyl-ACP--UDP-N-acetylglucosamine O-acyltransferase [unclassified Laspinema]MCT7971696.1 acyl-ACP--UDP-N-acetylglucosamine O-acyltransferase [Laspinema sp. D3d]MCT7977183.1 acyl-ACP--UDP-N-acetylglucosamine O-acyltransferase [Laspinema sp. D3b]MCT7987933.1 acyl-ACP--UDP-N-acetylglucosamine O-acyltransferase [Laspinema sp. D3a]